MKKYLILLIILIVSSCKNSDMKDTSANTIVPESVAKKSKSYFPVSEDMTIDNSIIIDLPSDKLTETITNKLSSKGKSLNTVNSDGSIYIISTASTAIPMNKSGFITSRNIAFSKAELRAKVELLKLSGEVITSERNSALISKNIQGTDTDAIQKVSLIKKIVTLADRSLDEALSQLGVSGTEIAKMNQSQKEKRYSENFNNYVSSFVGSMVKGISVIKIAEGEVGSSDYEVAVCIKYSPEQQSEAANIKNLGASKEMINAVNKKFKTISAESLVSKFGAQFFKDKNEKRYVLGFGQSAIQKTKGRQSTFINIGRKKARLQAVQNIKNLLAEDLVGKEISESIEKVSEFQDGEESLYTVDKFTELIKSKRSSIELSTLKIKDWTGTHPVSNTTIVGTIVILTESNKLDFNNSINRASEKTNRSKYHVTEDIEGEEF